MKEIQLNNVRYSNANQVRDIISALFINKEWDFEPKYFKSINAREDKSFGKGIYFTSNMMLNRFSGFFTAKDLFPDLTLDSDLHDEIALVRNIKLPDGDIPNGFSEVEKESYKRMHPNYIEADDCFRIGMINKITNTQNFHEGNQKGAPNYLFRELSTKAENFVTFESLMKKEIKKPINDAFEMLARFYYQLNMRHPNSMRLGCFDS